MYPHHVAWKGIFQIKDAFLNGTSVIRRFRTVCITFQFDLRQKLDLKLA